MTALSRRDFVRRGALWTLGAAIVTPPLRSLFAFPMNPLGPRTWHTVSLNRWEREGYGARIYFQGFTTADDAVLREKIAAGLRDGYRVVNHQIIRRAA
jgi:hypothetical protein